MSLLPRRLVYGEGATAAEHLDELRQRVITILLALALTTVVAFSAQKHILHWLNAPLPAGRRTPTTFGVSEPFTVALTVSLYAGFVLALPMILWQVWSFLAPAFDDQNQRRVRGLVAFAVALGASGLAFGYWILLPRAVRWLTNFDSHEFHIQIQAKPYYSFVSTVLLGMVLVFELPMAVLGLVYIGAVSSSQLRRYRRRGYFIVAFIALGLPGPDPLTTVLELLPMWVLFEGSIWLAVVAERLMNSAIDGPTPATPS
jgi:sec-independent protein translocase protein TatC